MNAKTIVITGIVGVGVLIAVAAIGILVLGGRPPPAPVDSPPAALEPRPAPGSEHR